MFGGSKGLLALRDFLRVSHPLRPARCCTLCGWCCHLCMTVLSHIETCGRHEGAVFSSQRPDACHTALLFCAERLRTCPARADAYLPGSVHDMCRSSAARGAWNGGSPMLLLCACAAVARGNLVSREVVLDSSCNMLCVLVSQRLLRCTALC